MMRFAIACGVVILVTGCGLIPDVYHEPTLHNPFPQLTKVAVVPFFNASTEPSVDGRQFALAYCAELQAIPGFEVVPIGVVETAIHDHRIDLSPKSPAPELRRLAQLLEVDAVVVGIVTDFTPYYPPRCGMNVEWYSANPGFHPIPPGYGLPWGTPAEEDIPQSLVLETEMALAREQLKTQTPACPPEPAPAVPARRDNPTDGSGTMLADKASIAATLTDAAPSATAGNASAAGTTASNRRRDSNVKTAACTECQPHPANSANGLQSAQLAQPGGPDGGGGGLPPDWPDPRGLVPPPPSCQRPECHRSDEPVMQHTKIYLGNDPDFTASLQNYAVYRDDARFGGWGSYLQRSDDFIRFCCHRHIAEMLTARGGAGQTRVVIRWPESRYIP